MKTLALFDFDGTVTTKDTLLEFIRYYRGTRRFYAGFLLLAPFAVLYALKILPNWKFKVIVLRHFFKNEDVSHFDSKCVSFCNEILPGLIRKEAMNEILKLKNDSMIYIVSASADWIKPWCRTHDIACICTKLERVDNKITGNIDGNNCYGIEKAIRIKKEISLSTFSEILAFGDSAGDKEMFELATHTYYKPFRQT